MLTLITNEGRMIRMVNRTGTTGVPPGKRTPMGSTRTRTVHAAAAHGLVAAMLALGLFACTGAGGGDGGFESAPCVEPIQPPSRIVLIAIDSLRPDHLGVYGYPRPTSPSTDALAADGIVFDDAMSTTSWTLPSHISMLTGLYPEVHGVVDRRMKMDPKTMLLSEMVRPLGFTTGGFVSGPFLSRNFGYSQGFDVYDDETIHHKGHEDSHSGITSPVLHESIAAWVRENADRPFFLFAHYWDVHYDLEPPPPYDSLFDSDYQGSVDGTQFIKNPAINSEMAARDLEHVIALYDGEIAFTDAYVGKLLDLLRELGIYDESLIVFTADHGDEFFEHNEKGHMKNLFETSVAVPLIVKLPGNQFAGTRVEGPVSLVDIAPTVMDSLRQVPHPDFNGRSLLPLIQTGSVPGGDDRAVFAELCTTLRAIRRGDEKYITRWEHPKGEEEWYFDLGADPMEQDNRIKNEAREAGKLRALLVEWIELSARLAENLGASELEYAPELEDQLLSLGYLE